MALLGATTGLYAYLMGPALRFLLTGGTEGLGLAGRLFPAFERADRAQVLWMFPAVVLAAIYTTGSYVRDGLQIAILFGVAVALDWRVAVGTLVMVPLAVVPVA